MSIILVFFAATSYEYITFPFLEQDITFCFRFVDDSPNNERQINFRNFKVAEYYYSDNKHDISFDNEMFSVSIDCINLSANLVVPYFVQQAPIMPISIYGIFVRGFSSLRQQYIPGAQDFYGFDWKLNIEQYMLKTELPSGGAFYTYINESGALDIFLLEAENDTYYVNSSGLAYNPSTGWLGKKGNRQMYHFDSNGRLDKIQNPDGQYIQII